MRRASSVGGISPACDSPPSRATERRSGPGPQAGFSLIEVLIAVALVGLVVLSLTGGLLTLVRIEDDTAQRQRLEHSLNNYAEGLRSLDYRDCAAAPGNAEIAAYTSDYAASALSWTPPAGMDVEITDLRFWDSDQRRFVDDCVGADGGAQELTVEARWRGRTTSGQIVLGAR